MGHYLLRNREDLLALIVKLYDNGDLPSGIRCPEEFDDFFGIHRDWDENTGLYIEPLDAYDGVIDSAPESYPSVCILDFDVANNFRYGNTTIKILDYVYPTEFERK